MNNCHNYDTTYFGHLLHEYVGSDCGVVVKLLTCGARGPEFESRSRRYDSGDWFNLLLPSRDTAERLLKRRKSSKKTNRPTMNMFVFYIMQYSKVYDIQVTHLLLFSPRRQTRPLQGQTLTKKWQLM